MGPVQSQAGEYQRWLYCRHNFESYEVSKVLLISSETMMADLTLRKLYKEDIKLLETFKCNAYRLSISWSRVIPTGGVKTQSIRRVRGIMIG